MIMIIILAIVSITLFIYLFRKYKDRIKYLKLTSALQSHSCTKCNNGYGELDIKFTSWEGGSEGHNTYLVKCSSCNAKTLDFGHYSKYEAMEAWLGDKTYTCEKKCGNCSNWTLQHEYKGREGFIMESLGSCKQERWSRKSLPPDSDGHSCFYFLPASLVEQN